MLSLLVAAADNGTIGRDGGLPWHLPQDLRRFRTLTLGHVVVMGRRTHESIVARLGRPLDGRLSVVVSSSVAPDGSVAVARTFADAAATAAAASRFHGTDEVFVAGGAQVYLAALPTADRVHLTRVTGDVEGDVALPSGWLDGFALTSASDPIEEGGHKYAFEQYDRL